MSAPLLAVEGLRVGFPLAGGLFGRSRTLIAVDDVKIGRAHV